jgi:hypothetical protein
MDRIDYREWSLKTLERGLLPPGLLADPNVENKTGDNELKESTDPAARSEEKQVVSSPFALFRSDVIDETTL